MPAALPSGLYRDALHDDVGNLMRVGLNLQPLGQTGSCEERRGMSHSLRVPVEQVACGCTICVES